MRKKLLVILSFFIFQSTSFGQTTKIKVQKGEFIPASFPGGRDSLNRYFNKGVLDEIRYRANVPSKIHFRSWLDIDPKGKVINVDLITGSGYRDIDSIFVNAVKNMPNWIPAIDENKNNCKDRKFLPFNIKYE